MNEETIKLVVPFASLIEALSALSLSEKRKLREFLDEELTEYEETLWESDPISQAEIQEARVAYETGDYVTLNEYIANQVKPES